MINPWVRLSTNAPHVLSDDYEIIAEFNRAQSGRHDYQIQTQVLPEPYIGNPNSPVYILGLNPGYSKLDDYWHSKREFSEAIIRNLSHKPAVYPFYFFDPIFKEAPGSDWWTKRSKWLLNDVGSEVLARSIFCVELFPYHSRKYKPIPKSISEDSLVPSSQYSAYLIHQAIRANKTIIAMRAVNQWLHLVPELEAYHRLYKLNSPQNVCLSPNNLPSYKSIVAELIDNREAS